MALRITTELDYVLADCADVLLQLEAAAIPEQFVSRAHIDLPPTEHFARLPGHDGIGERIWLRLQGDLTVRYTATVEVRRMLADVATLAAVPPHQLPGETIEYLMPSRYCPSDQFEDLVEAEFGHLEAGARVAEMRDWIGRHLAYVPGSSDSATCAQQTYIRRKGVCRDYAHLLIAMTRASAIPARFASVYGLGVDPPDFHAVAEVFLEGAWHLVDATGMSSAADMAKIGVGRDAADVSFLTCFGTATLRGQSVLVEPA